MARLGVIAGTLCQQATAQQGLHDVWGSPCLGAAGTCLF
jgi:hypothetical protein